MALLPGFPEWAYVTDDPGALLVGGSHPSRIAIRLGDFVGSGPGLPLEISIPFENVVFAGPIAHSSETHVLIDVLFATDRGRDGSARFNSRRSQDGSLAVGVCTVSIPRDHRLARLERPAAWRFWTDGEVGRHFMILARADLADGEFADQLSAQAGAPPQSFVFVHGYRTTFDDAIYRTAQLAYDLGFAGVPIAYSWPSAGNSLGYLSDLNNAEWSSEHLARFLARLRLLLPDLTIHTLAHSMGNRVLAGALQLVDSAASLQMDVRLNQVVLTAPDIDAAVFRRLAKSITARATQVTMYASINDEALRVARALQGGYIRAGDASEILIVHGVDTIDASAVDTNLVGHSYYGDNRSVLSDIFSLISTGARPSGRFGIEPATLGGQVYWTFRA